MCFNQNELFFRSASIEHFDKKSNEVLPNTFIDQVNGNCSIDRQKNRQFDAVCKKLKSRFMRSKNHIGMAYFDYLDVQNIIHIIPSPSKNNKYHCHFESDLAKAVLIAKLSKFKLY